MSRLVLTAAVASALALAAPGSGPARAQPTPAPPPSQALDLDPEPPLARYAGSVDVLGPVFGLYGARLALALDRWHAGSVDVGAALDAGRWRARALVAWQVWPLARGLRGPWAALACGAEAGPQGSAWRAPLRVEAGVQGVWGDVAVALSVAAERDLRTRDGSWRVRIGLHVGWVARG